MRTIHLVVLTALIATSTNRPCRGLKAAEYPDPGRFENAIKAFEAEAQKQPPPKNAIVCIGSSSMRVWHGEIKQDLAPITVIPRGFGGSNMNDALHFCDRIVLPYAPRAVVIYEGDNDIAQGISPQKIADTCKTFVAKVRGTLPTCRIYFLSIKPSIKRWALWPKMVEANTLIREYCETDTRLTYVDVASGMLNAAGQPRKDIFRSDDLHMVRAGYEIWRDTLRPILLKEELKYEANLGSHAIERFSGKDRSFVTDQPVVKAMLANEYDFATQRLAGFGLLR